MEGRRKGCGLFCSMQLAYLSTMSNNFVADCSFDNSSFSCSRFFCVSLALLSTLALAVTNNSDISSAYLLRNVFRYSVYDGLQVGLGLFYESPELNV